MVDSVQVFGRKKTSVAVAYCKRGRGLIRVNGQPIEFLQPEMLRLKLLEPMLILGQQRFQLVDIRLRVQGGGYTSQVYGQSQLSQQTAPRALPGCASPLPRLCLPSASAIRQAIAKALVAFYQKCQAGCRTQPRRPLPSPLPLRHLC